MARSIPLFLILVILVACAGCSAFDSSDTTISTVTPAPVPTDQQTPTPVSQLAPGVTKFGLVNASALIEAHTARLANTSYTVHSAWILTYPNGTVAAQTAETIRIGNTGTYSTWNATGFPDSVRDAEAWQNANATVGISKITHNNSTEYNRYPVRYHTSRRRIAHIINSFYITFEPQEMTVTTLTRNGTTVYRLNGTDPVSNVTMNILVDSRGLIHSYTLNKQISDSPVRNVTRSIRTAQFASIGTTTVTRPSWYATALNETTPLRKPNTTTTRTG